MALVMRKEGCNVVEARERVRKMTEGERRRGKEEVREGKRGYEREVEECCAWRPPVVGEEKEEEEESDDDDLPLPLLFMSVKGAKKRRRR